MSNPGAPNIGRADEATRFRPGRKNCLPAVVEVPDDGSPQLLRDMRYVYLNDDRQSGSTPGQKALKRMKRDNLAGFMKQMMQMEKEWEESSKKRKSEVVEDEGMGRCIVMCEDWLHGRKGG